MGEFSSPQGTDSPNAFLILMLNSELANMFFLIILSLCSFWFDVLLSNVMVFIDFFVKCYLSVQIIWGYFVYMQML